MATDIPRTSAASFSVKPPKYRNSITGLEVGRFIFFDLGGATEESVEVLALDPDNQTFDAVVTRSHPACALRPCIWPTPILNEGNDLAFDIKAVASPNPGSDLTVVIQT